MKLFISLFFVLSGFIPTQKTENKYTLVVFEGSDWCSNCRKFEHSILQDSLVLNYLKKVNIELLKVDFPQRKKLSKEQQKLNQQYAEKYAFKGLFPTIILSRTDTLFYKEINSKNMTPSIFISQLENTQLILK